MKILLGKAAMVAALVSVSTQPAQACWNNQAVTAAKIMNLNNMLMVTALRCRKGSSNFLPEYNRFVKGNRGLLAGQHAVAKQHFARKVGARRAVGALDKFNISLANSYGAGHRSMNCKELKNLARKVAGRQTVSSLIVLADQSAGMPRLPGGRCKTRVASRK